MKPKPSDKRDILANKISLLKKSKNIFNFRKPLNINDIIQFKRDYLFIKIALHLRPRLKSIEKNFYPRLLLIPLFEKILLLRQVI